jgi:hypothetical protein
MQLVINPRIASVIGPQGERLSLDNLPASTTTRWVVRRKAEVLAAVNGGLLTPAQACARYELSLAELAEWQRAVDAEGVAGLRSERVQHRRRSRQQK